jgi:hypothetical protein
MLVLRVIFLAALLGFAGASGAQSDKLKPTVDADCMAEDADYDCQPTDLAEKDYDKMASTINMARDLPALVEMEPLDSDGAFIKRYMLNARGVMGREVPIPGSEDHYCTLSAATNVTLSYFPVSGLWVFVVGFGPQAELMAGGLATCLDVSQAVERWGNTDER